MLRQSPGLTSERFAVRRGFPRQKLPPGVQLNCGGICARVPRVILGDATRRDDSCGQCIGLKCTRRLPVPEDRRTLETIRESVDNVARRALITEFGDEFTRVLRQDLRRLVQLQTG